MATSETECALQQAAEGLTYQSETDAPWQAFRRPRVKGEPTAEAVRRWGRHPADAPVEEQTVEEFFGPLVEEKDWYGDEERAVAAQYQALLAAVTKCLRQPRVFRIGERRVTVYVVGMAPEGGWAGLTTSAVET